MSSEPYEVHISYYADAYWERELEAEVFLEAFGNTQELLDSEYGKLAPQSFFISVTEKHGEVVGTIRVAVAGHERLKTLDDLEWVWGLDSDRIMRAIGVELPKTWDIVTISVRKDRRGTEVPLILYHALIKAGLANHIECFVAILDDNVLRLLSAIGFHPNTLPAAYSQPYLGSAASTPIYFNLASLDRMRMNNPEAYNLIVRAKGLDNIKVPTSGQLVLEGGPLRV